MILMSWKNIKKSKRKKVLFVMICNDRISFIFTFFNMHTSLIIK